MKRVIAPYLKNAHYQVVMGAFGAVFIILVEAMAVPVSNIGILESIQIWCLFGNAGRSCLKCWSIRQGKRPNLITSQVNVIINAIISALRSNVFLAPLVQELAQNLQPLVAKIVKNREEKNGERKKIYRHKDLAGG